MIVAILQIQGLVDPLYYLKYASLRQTTLASSAARKQFRTIHSLARLRATHWQAKTMHIES